MKIVQSFWSKPAYKTDSYHTADRNNGGWKDKRYNFMSWALSCLQFKNFYKNVELITDEFGYDLLINKLNLPYTDCKVVLDELDDYHPDLWAIGKIYAYGVQDEPFIHADGDVYIWARFSDEIHNAQLIAQNIEQGFNPYIGVFNSILTNFRYVPPVLIQSNIAHKGIVGVNAGILGGSNLDFFKSYTDAAKLFVQSNIDVVDKIDTGLFNIIFEQFLFCSLAEEQRLEITYLLKSVNKSYDGLAELTEVPLRTQYAHPVSVYKKQDFICHLLEERLHKDHPKYYWRIINLLHTSQI